MTAYDLLTYLREIGCNPRVEDAGLVADDIPDALADYDAILHTGVTALILGRPWYAIDKNGRGCGRFEFGSISPREPIPASAYLLCAGGCDWDYLPAGAIGLVPDCFGASALVTRS